jgi:hypothetical protein
MNIAIAAPEPLVSYHSTQVDGLEIFYREAGPKDAHDSSSTWVAVIFPDVSVAAGIQSLRPGLEIEGNRPIDGRVHEKRSLM